jgi:S1-C subfamily serine protease
VNTPNGEWICDDDSGGNFDPLVQFDDPQSGVYDIWVGVFDEENSNPNATLYLSELGAETGTTTVGGTLNDRDNFFGSGTAFLVSDLGYLVTNEHVIHDRESVYIMYQGEIVSAEVIARDTVNDVAILKADVTGMPFEIGSSRSVVRGSEVMTLGYPNSDSQGQNQKASFGRINSLTGFGDDIRYFQIDVPVQPGNSGGPLINARGQVVGIVTSRLNEAQVVNFAIKSDYIFPLLPDEALTSVTEENSEMSMEELSNLFQESVFIVSTE